MGRARGVWDRFLLGAFLLVWIFFELGGGDDGRGPTKAFLCIEVDG